MVLGVGQIIKGLDIGMADMCAGEKRKITVPPALAFGENGKGEFWTERRGRIGSSSPDEVTAPPL